MSLTVIFFKHISKNSKTDKKMNQKLWELYKILKIFAKKRIYILNVEYLKHRIEVSCAFILQKNMINLS